jgi:hypothetical protein
MKPDPGKETGVSNKNCHITPNQALADIGWNAFSRQIQQLLSTQVDF